MSSPFYTCKCGAIFPPTPFCMFCGEQVPISLLFAHVLRQETAAEELGFQLDSPSRCNDLEHSISAMTAKLPSSVPSKNGEIKFCSKCGKKLPEV